jgi:hypothetical protein
MIAAHLARSLLEEPLERLQDDLILLTARFAAGPIERREEFSAGLGDINVELHGHHPVTSSLNQ